MAGAVLVAVGAAGLDTANSASLYSVMITVGAVLIGASVMHFVLFTRAAMRGARLAPPDLSHPPSDRAIGVACCSPPDFTAQHQ